VVTPIYSGTWQPLVFWATVVAWVVLDVRLALVGFARGERGPSPTTRAETGSSRLGLVVLDGAMVSGLAVAAVRSLVLPGSSTLLVVGLVVAWSGLGLRWWAKHTLGRLFVAALVIQDGHHIVDTGPYAVIRHPGYAGAVLAMLGMGVATANVGAIVLMGLLPLVLFAWRIPIEERLLVTGLGRPYIDYQAATARLVPRIW
jgi:protein-S-isoprenylcysteine O-methyltransferase Ste14